MSDDDQNLNDESSTKDSRLEAFLRQASAIIAAEKGLNNAAKAKLDALAMQLHLPEELFEIGLKKLQDSNSPIGDLTAYEQGFLDFLIKEFRQKPKGTVLSISIEEKAIAHAKEKFEIPSHRAEKLIAFQTEASGFGRLSRSDAKEFGRQMIVDHVGEKVSLDERTEKRVFRIGRHWGCSKEEVEQLINEKFAENHRIAKAERRRPILLGLAMLGCFALIGAASWWLISNREMIFENPTVKKDPIPVEPMPDDESFDSSETALRAKDVLFPKFDDLLRSENPETRANAIADVAKQILNPREGLEGQLEAIKHVYFGESDPAVANRFVQEIDNALSSEPRTNRKGELGVPYRAAEIALNLSNAKVSGNQNEQRADALAQVLKNRTGVKWNDSVGLGLSLIDSAIAIRQWNQLIQNAWTSPGRCSFLVEPLSSLTQSKLPAKPHSQYVSRSVRTIITADAGQWRNMKNAIRDAISTADEVQRIEWLDVWLDEFDGTKGFREFSAPLLFAGVQKAVLTMRDYESLIRSERSGWRNRQLRPALLRHQKIDAAIEQLRPYFSPRANFKANPDLVYQAVSTANLCLEAIAITNDGRAGDESAWSDVDVQLERFDQRLRDFVFLEEPQSNDAPRVSSAGFDTTARDRTLRTFSDLSDSNQAKRLSAIERLPKIAARFDSIPQPFATALANYLLSPIESEEWLRMQRVLPDLSRWPRLVMALSDRLPDSNAPIDQVMTMFTVLTGERLEISNGDWRSRLADELVAFAHKSLMQDSVVDPSSSDSDWVRLEKYLSSSYYRRSILLGGNGLVDDRSALNLSKRCAIAFSDNAPATKRAIGLIEESTENEMQQILLCNQLLSGQKKLSEQDSMGARLFDSELSLLMKWNRERENQLKGIMNEN
jgi:hypothetical protein